MTSSLLSVVSSVLAGLVDLAAPAVCAGCGSPGARVCPPCCRLLDTAWFPAGPAVVRHLDGAGGTLPCVAAGRFEGVARELLHGYKDGDRRDLAPLLAAPLAAGVVTVAGHDPPRPVLLVPAPSARATERRRGDRPVALLAELAAVACAGLGLEARVVRALEVGRRVADQATLGRAARAGNVDHAYRLRRAARATVTGERSAGALVLVVDDVLTTGATAGECVRALDAGGVGVHGVVTVLATPRRR